MKYKVHAEQKKLSPRERLLEKYIRENKEDEIPMFNVGKDITRPLNATRLAQYRKCPDCKNGSKENPIKVTIQFLTAKGETRCLTICRKHWEKLADSDIGWSGISGEVN